MLFNVALADLCMAFKSAPMSHMAYLEGVCGNDAGMCKAAEFC